MFPNCSRFTWLFPSFAVPVLSRSSHLWHRTPTHKLKDAHGIELAEETILGDDLISVVRAALNYRNGSTLDENGYKQAFRLYFEYGCHRLKQIWDEYNGDQTMFTAALIKLARSGPEPIMGEDSSSIPPLAVVEHAVRVKLLADIEPWTINAAGGNCLLIRPDLSVNQAAYLTRASRKNFFTRSGDFSSICMCSFVAALSLALVRTGTFV